MGCDVCAKPRGRLGRRLEFVDLVNALRYHIGQEGNRGVEANVAGHLRGFAHWQNDLNTTDSVGFSALPGGYRGDPTGFIEPDYLGVWWTSDVQDNIFITRRNQVEDTGIGRMLSTPGSGYSLRCVQN